MNHLSWSRIIQNNSDEKYFLCCLPYAGGGANIFRSWALWGKDKLTVLSLSMPGREGKLNLPPYTQYSQLIADLVDLFRTDIVQPYSIFGYSLGALFAYDLVKTIKNKQYPLPDYLFVAGMSAPQTIKNTKKYADFSDDELLDDLLSDPNSLMHQYPELISLQRLLLPTLRADHKLYEDYQSKDSEKVDCPIVVFAGEQDREHPKHNIEAWSELSTRSTEFFWYQGQHMFFNQYQKNMFELISTRLAL